MRFSFCLIFLLFFFSCVNKDKIPSGILSRERMKEVLWDLMRADEMVKNNFINDSTLDEEKESFRLYEEVFSIHNISEDKFKKSLAFYQSRPDLLKLVIDSLQSHERLANEERYKPRPLTDTLPFKRIKPVKK